LPIFEMLPIIAFMGTTSETRPEELFHLIIKIIFPAPIRSCLLTICRIFPRDFSTMLLLFLRLVCYLPLNLRNAQLHLGHALELTSVYTRPIN